eukprot:6180762-Pleurochrysis_carterae.AAC.1
MKVGLLLRRGVFSSSFDSFRQQSGFPACASFTQLCPSRFSFEVLPGLGQHMPEHLSLSPCPSTYPSARARAPIPQPLH